MNSSIIKLQELLKDDKVIPVVGAGFSNAVAKLPGWSKLIELGFKYARDRNLNNDLILVGEKYLKENELLKASNILKELLHAPRFPFVNFIKDLFEYPEIVSNDLIDSILDLSTKIIITTNYDTLLSSVSNYSPKTKYVHNEYQEVINSIKKDEEIIIHIHGIYDRPDTIILSEEDYNNLNKDIGYKNLLQKLLSDYHFLFIGCSKDGVMDQDFLPVFNFIKDYFPYSSNQHFILLHEKEIVSQNHIPLLTECNVEAISYGNDYNFLTQFINGFNPNFDKKQLKIEKFKVHFDSEIKRIAKITNSFSENTEEIDKLIADTFKSKYDWVDTEKLDALKNVLNEYNKSLSNKKEKLLFIQSIIKSIFNVTELKEKVDLWNLYGDTPDKLNPLNFISTALLAYDCLLKIPQELVDDIEKSNYWYVFHNGFYNGYLGQFINEINTYKKLGLNLEEIYKGDRYLFENLKRIIQSLQSFLELDANSFYSEIESAVISNDLPKKFIATVSASEIKVRDTNDLNKILARLFVDKNFSIPQIRILNIGQKKLIVGHDSHSCFYWNPAEDIYMVKFYTSSDAINEIIIDERNNEFIYTIYETNKLIIFDSSFQKVNEIKLKDRFLSIIKFSNEYVALKRGDSTYKGVILYQINFDDEIIPFLTYDDLLNYCKTDKIITRMIEEYEQIDPIANYTSRLTVKKQIDIKYNDQDFILLISDLAVKNSSSLIFILKKAGDNNLTILKVIHLKAICYCLDYKVNNKNQLQLVFGHLDIDNNPIMSEEIVLDNEFKIVDRQEYNYLQEKKVVRDILDCKYLDEDKILLSEEGKKVVLISNKKVEKEYILDDEEKISCISTI